MFKGGIYSGREGCMWGQLLVSAGFGRIRHLTRGHPLTDTADANPRGPPRSTLPLAIHPVG